MFFDAHIHNHCSESGGFVIGLEGLPHFDGTLNNADALKMHAPDKNYISFYYVSADEIGKKLPHKYIKIHPRREKYNPDDVIKCIRKNKPRCVIIDTLNEPFWVPYDYWNIARAFPEITFVFAHSGGYLINDFIKICHFQPNVWIDFALTHTTLGRFGNKKCGLSYIDAAIRYAVNAPFKNRVLLSSDFPFFFYSDVVKYYKKLGVIKMLNDNFVQLLKVIK